MKSWKSLLGAALVLCTATVWAEATPSPILLRAKAMVHPQQSKPITSPGSRQWQVSIIPTPVLTSYYDYMIGGYNSLPMQIVPDEFGGGVFFTYHAKRTATGIRKSCFSYLNDAGVLQPSVEPVWNNYTNGYPTVDFDPVVGKPLYAWHGNADGTTDSAMEIMGTYDQFIGGNSGLLADPYPIFNPTVTSPEYLWPIIKTGPSPLAGMRRAYAMASTLDTMHETSMEVPAFAYADFNASMLESGMSLTWNTIPTPPLGDWLADPDVARKTYFTFTVDQAGNIFYTGNHEAYLPEDGASVNEPDIDVFMCGNYGQGTWQHYNTSSRTPFWNLGWMIAPEIVHHWIIENESGEPPATGSLYWKVVHSGHKDAVIDNDGILHVPSLWALHDEDYYIPDLHVTREYTFDPISHAFSIKELYPAAGEPADTTWWSPWDTDGNNVIDDTEFTGDYPSYQTSFPFPHWNDAAHEYAMMYHYNNVKMTEPNAQGWMAAVWQECRRARLYNRMPDYYPDYAPYAQTPEINISLSNDNGQHWSAPYVLNNVDNPELAGIKPMWVYPANQIEVRTTPGGQQTMRMYMMFYNDTSWGSYAMTPPEGQNDGGAVMYMALDYPLVGSTDPVQPPALTLAQNYPNPFNPSTTISYTLGKSSQVELTIYNQKGQRVKQLCNSAKPVGTHSIVWDGTDDKGQRAASGVYHYKIKGGSFTTTKKMILLK